MNVKNAVRRYTNHCLMLGVLSAGALLPSVAHASLSFGTFNAIGNASISTGSISFTNSPIFSVGTAGFNVINGTTGTFKNITNPPYVVNTTFPTPNFLTFNALPGTSLTLTSLLGGTFGLAGCATNGPCTPPNSPYNLFNQGGNAVASFSVVGFETDGTNTTPFSGTFSATFANTTYQAVTATVLGGGTVSTTYTGSFFVAPTPEPAFLLFPLAAGLIGIVGLSRRRAQNKV